MGRKICMLMQLQLGLEVDSLVVEGLLGKNQTLQM